MGNLIKSKIIFYKFAKEVFRCSYVKGNMGIHTFEKEANKLIHDIDIKIGALLTKATFTPNPLIAIMDKKASDENRLVFNDIFNEDEKYALVDGRIEALSSKCSYGIDKINREKQEELATIMEFYKNIYTLMGNMIDIPLTPNMTYSYGLFSNCHFRIKGKNDQEYEVRETDDELEYKEDTSNCIHIYREYIYQDSDIASIEDTYVKEFESIRDAVLDEMEKINAKLLADEGVTTESNNVKGLK